jgi:hypothetical protein
MAMPIHVKSALEREPTAFRSRVFAKTADFSPTIRQTGATFTNLGASAGITFTLPTNSSGEKGLTYTFTVMAAQTVTIDPGSAGAFYIAGAKLADDTNIVLREIGDTVTVTSDGNGDWIVSEVPVIAASYVMNANADLADQAFFVANRPYRVVRVREVHSTAGSDGSAVNVQVTKDDSTDAPGAGDNLLTNNTNAGFNLKGTANTVQAGTLATTADLMTLAAGDRLSVDFAGTLTAVAGVVVTVDLVPITWA